MCLGQEQRGNDIAYIQQTFSTIFIFRNFEVLKAQSLLAE